jgi:hypothetical protein
VRVGPEILAEVDNEQFGSIRSEIMNNVNRCKPGAFDSLRSRRQQV